MQAKQPVLFGTPSRGGASCTQQRIMHLETVYLYFVSLRIGEALGVGRLCVLSRHREACCAGYKLQGQTLLFWRLWDEALV